MTDATEWRGRVGEAWAEEWRRTDRTLEPVNDILVAEASAQLIGIASPHVLDIGCGAGATSLALHDRIPDVEIVGIDLSGPLVAVASQRAALLSGIRFEVGDAATWMPNGRRFDAIVSRHGVMFFDDPVAAFDHLRVLGTPDVRLIFSCFRPRADNAWAVALQPILERFAAAAAAAPPPAAGPFALGEPERITEILTQAGFAAPRIEPFDFPFVTGVGSDPVGETISYFRRIGPFAALLRELDEASAAEANEMLAGIAAEHLVGDTVRFPAAIWLVSTRPA